jgi:hypothetical protein
MVLMPSQHTFPSQKFVVAPYGELQVLLMLHIFLLVKHMVSRVWIPIIDII